jgi:hypothetical protein
MQDIFILSFPTGFGGRGPLPAEEGGGRGNRLLFYNSLQTNPRIDKSTH